MKTQRYYISPISDSYGKQFKAFYVAADSSDEALGKACSKLKHTVFVIMQVELKPEDRSLLLKKIELRLEQLHSQRIADVWKFINRLT